MTRGSYEIECNMTSSANDVWGAIFAATSVFPEFLPDLYAKIRSTRRDGYNEGSMREITYGPDFDKLVTVSEEQLTEVDHDKMMLRCTVVSGELKNKHYRSFETTTTVTPRENNEGPRSPGCDVTWKCTYTEERGTLSTDAVIKFVKKTFKELDSHLLDLMKNS